MGALERQYLNNQR